MHKGTSKWCGLVTCFKQQTVIEFLLEEKESVTNIHIQLKNVCGVNAVDIGTVIHWASVACSENNHMELSDMHRLDWPTAAVTQAWLSMLMFTNHYLPKGSHGFIERISPTRHFWS
jgi:hypothetical protein